MRAAAVYSAAENAEYWSEERCHILELANDPADRDASIARARVAPGIATKAHRLAGTAERYVIVSGSGRVSVEGLGEREVAPGDVVYIPAGARQSIRNTGKADLVFLCICTPRFQWENYESLE